MASVGPIVSKIEAAGTSIWQGIKSLGGAAKETGNAAKAAVGKGDGYVKGFLQYDGSFGAAVKGIAKDKPVTSTLAAAALVGGTVYAGKQVFGSHSERVVRERSNGSEIGR